MLKVVVMAGYKDVGKTAIVEKLIEELKSRGYRVGSIKHVPHEDFTLDRPETDTWRHRQAGSEKIVAISPEEIATLKREKTDLEKDEVGLYPTLNRVLLSSRDLDFVIIEGFREAESMAKIMVARDEKEAEELDDMFTIGFVGQGVKEKPVLDRDDVSAIADLVEEKAIPPVAGIDDGDCGYGTCKAFALSAINGEAPKDGCVSLFGGVTLKVDGKQVPIKLFVQDLLAGTIEGMVSSLKGAEGGDITIEVSKHGE